MVKKTKNTNVKRHMRRVGKKKVVPVRKHTRKLTVAERQKRARARSKARTKRQNKLFSDNVTLGGFLDELQSSLKADYKKLKKSFGANPKEDDWVVDEITGRLRHKINKKQEEVDRLKNDYADRPHPNTFARLRSAQTELDKLQSPHGYKQTFNELRGEVQEQVNAMRFDKGKTFEKKKPGATQIQNKGRRFVVEWDKVDKFGNAIKKPLPGRVPPKADLIVQEGLTDERESLKNKLLNDLKVLDSHAKKISAVETKIAESGLKEQVKRSIIKKPVEFKVLDIEKPGKSTEKVESTPTARGFYEEVEEDEYDPGTDSYVKKKKKVFRQFDEDKKNNE